MTSFATELATPTVTDVRTDTLPRLIYKYKDVNHQPLNSYISRPPPAGSVDICNVKHCLLFAPRTPASVSAARPTFCGRTRSGVRRLAVY